MLALLLLVPGALNVTVGSSLGVWWAPFPVWMFLLAVWGVPLIMAVILPMAAFVVLAGALVRVRRVSTLLLAGFVATSTLLHVWWISQWWSEGVWRLGMPYTAAVFGFGSASLVLSAVFLVIGLKRNAFRHLSMSAWFAGLWWAWWAMPWLGEAI